jgi:nitrogen fixation protein FixH
MMKNAAHIPPDTGKELKGRHVIYWLLGFFGLMFVVNGIFLFHAIDSFPGEDVEKSYLQGLNYNETLSQRADQAALGWHAAMGLEGEQLVLQLETANGAVLSGQQVTARMRRLATTAADQDLTLEPSADGSYRASLAEFQTGQWEVTAQVWERDVDAPVFVARKTVTIR